MGRLLPALAFTLLCATALAQAPSDAELEAARELARQALAALENRDFATSDDLLSRAIAVYDAPTLRLARARARGGADHMIAAAEDYQVAERWPSEAGEPAVFVQVRQDAGRELDVLEPRIPRLTVALQGTATVRVGGVVWPAGTIGVARRVDPGMYVVEAVWSTGETSRVNVQLAVGQRETAVLRPDAGAVHAPITAAPNAASGAAQSSAPRSIDQSDMTSGTATHPRAVALQSRHDPIRASWTHNTPALVVGGISVALLVAAIVAGARTLTLNSDFRKINNARIEMSRKEDKRSDVIMMRGISTGLMAAAIIGGGITTYLFLVPSTDTEAESGRARMMGRRFGLRATLEGRF